MRVSGSQGLMLMGVAEYLEIEHVRQHTLNMFRIAAIAANIDRNATTRYTRTSAFGQQPSDTSGRGRILRTLRRRLVHTAPKF